VKKWLDDAYLNFGLEIGKGKIIFCPIIDPDMQKEANEWRIKERQLSFTISEKRCRNFPDAGLYLFYHYFVEIIQTAGQMEIYTGRMPANLLKLLTHYLFHRFTVPDSPMGI
jgi:hypothetical protein